MGRPVSDDEGGFGHRAGATSQDFMTLNEFLAEGLDKPSSTGPAVRLIYLFYIDY